MINEKQQEWLRTLIDRFCSEPARKRLYDEVGRSTPITFKPSQDEHWGSVTQGDKTTIFFSPSTHPEAALAHELLHAKLKISGYKQYCTAVALTPKRHLLPTVLGILDNELQHHKFFRDFAALGFPANEMYADSDKDWALHLKQDIEGLSPEKVLELFFNSYVTLIAPGGFGTDEERKKLERMMQERSAPGYWKRLRAIKAAITEFRDSSSLDAAPTVARILRELGNHEPAWISFDQNFPSSGLFIGKSFTTEEAAAYMRDHSDVAEQDT